ncbi:unnamed protein product [Symbiodinium microadriaticum]|nr:unnamed protein product [Symbiodinium sp. KB8]CAE7331748.1 unnamed protein product [Symbiodinium microadriaticum]
MASSAKPQQVPGLSLEHQSLEASEAETNSRRNLQPVIISRLPPPFPLRAPTRPPSHRSFRSARQSQQTSNGSWHKATTGSTFSSQPPKTRGAWTTSQSSPSGRTKADEAFRKVEKSRSTGNMPLDHSGAKDGRQELMIAMRALFEAYDKDRSGSVNLDDFVETQAEVLSENEGGLHLPLQDLVAQYLEVRRPGQVGLDGAGLDFEGFVMWQLQWQLPLWANGTEKEVAEHCMRMKDHLTLTRPNASVRSAAPPRLPFTSRSRISSARRWPPGKVQACAVDLRETSRPKSARVRRYGGYATATKGFCEPPEEVFHDIQAFESVQNLKEEDSHDVGRSQSRLAETAAAEEESPNRSDRDPCGATPMEHVFDN